MTEIPESIQFIARRLWDMQQRLAVQIAEKPLEQREAAFSIVERVVRDMAKQMGNVPEDKMDDFVNLQMEVVRQFVTEIDVGGSPQGGNA